MKDKHIDDREVGLSDAEYLAGLISFLDANEKAKIARMVFEERMENIDHTFSEQDYQDKLEWLCRQGEGGKVKKLIEEREGWIRE